MSGSDIFDDDIKNYINELFYKHLATMDEDSDSEVDDRTLTDHSSNPSPATTDVTISRPETPEELLIDTINDSILAEELYLLLQDTPPTEMPSSLADAIVAEQNTHSDAVYNLIEDVIHDEAAALEKHGHIGIQKTASGFKIDTHVDRKRIVCAFNSLEEAAVAYIYARTRAADDKTSAYAYKTICKCLENPYYKKIYKNLDSYLQKYPNVASTLSEMISKAPIREIYNPDKYQEKKTAQGSKKRLKPS